MLLPSNQFLIKKTKTLVNANNIIYLIMYQCINHKINELYFDLFDFYLLICFRKYVTGNSGNW
jgi:hypothetical protein